MSDLASIKSHNLIPFLKENGLLSTCWDEEADDKIATLPEAGALVWARYTGSEYWPALRLKLKDKPGLKVEAPVENPINHENFTFVMFLEPLFRISEVWWGDVIPLSNPLDEQLPLILSYNKNILKKKKTTALSKSIQMIDEFINVPMDQRVKLAESKFKTLPRKSTPAPAKAEPKQVDIEPPKTPGGSRVSKRISELSSQEKKTQPVTSPIESKKKSIVATKPKTGENEVFGGKDLENQARERFERINKCFQFDFSHEPRCGRCQIYFHSNETKIMCHNMPHHDRCVETDAEGQKKCVNCIKNLCSSCREPKNDHDTWIKCSKCSLSYHMECLKGWPQAEVYGPNGPVVCPVHFCHTCLGEQRIYNKARDYTLTPSSKPIRCTQCLATYHKWCVPAGSGEVTEGNNHISCPKHSVQYLKVQQRRVGCLVCFKLLKSSEARIECTYCIQVVHPACVGYTEEIKKKGVSVERFGEEYQCVSCTWGLFPVYGQVVWFQQPGSQSWPARILYPEEFARRENLKTERAPGQYSIQYFGGTSLYDHASRTMPLHLTTVDIFKKLNVYKMVNKFQRAHEEAAYFLQASEEYRDKLLPVPKPVYKKIDKNVYRSIPTKKGQTKDKDVCSCASANESLDQTCLPDSGCKNRDMEMECSNATCESGPRCANRMFSERKNDTDFIEQKLFPKKGWGVCAKIAFKVGDFVAEYRGEVIDKEEMRWRLNRKNEEDPLYILEISTDFYIDAEFMGNLSRLINHSCDPNCEVRKYLSLGKSVGGIFALKDIQPGEELTFHYNYGKESTAPFRCHCGSPHCEIFIGKRVPEGYTVEEEPAVDSWDNICFKCGFGGSVICCEYPGCRVVGHYQCVGLSRLPKGNWCCPGHPVKVIGKNGMSKRRASTPKSKPKTTSNADKIQPEIQESSYLKVQAESIVSETVQLFIKKTVETLPPTVVAAKPKQSEDVQEKPQQLVSNVRKRARITAEKSESSTKVNTPLAEQSKNKKVQLTTDEETIDLTQDDEVEEVYVPNDSGVSNNAVIQRQGIKRKLEALGTTVTSTRQTRLAKSVTAVSGKTSESKSETSVESEGENKGHTDVTRIDGASAIKDVDTLPSPPPPVPAARSRSNSTKVRRQTRGASAKRNSKPSEPFSPLATNDLVTRDQANKVVSPRQSFLPAKDPVSTKRMTRSSTSSQKTPPNVHAL